MANKNIFQSLRGALVPKTNGTNEAGGRAYKLQPKQALAQYAATGCLNSTYYASAEDQLQDVMQLIQELDAEYVARTAVYSREAGLMKDMPALLCAALSVKDAGLLRTVFDRVIDDGRMLRNFVQVIRSGVLGRKSLGTAPKKLVQRWFNNRTDEQLFRASVGNSPSLADVVKMVHPKPGNPTREALYGYLLGQPHRGENLPEIVKQFEAFKAGKREIVPDVAFQLLTSLDLGRAEWTAIAEQASWQTTRMNLNTFGRHGVFEDPEMVQKIADRLANPEEVKRARVFPYQLLMAFKAAGKEVPAVIRDALQDTMEAATRNVPKIPGKVHVCPDVSGSMSSPVTGHRTGSTTAVRCVDVAALVAASMLRQNPSTEVIPFESQVVDVRLNARDSVMSNAQKLADIGGGGTNCSAPIAWLNQRGIRSDLVVLVSDNESWVDAGSGRGTETMRQWSIFKQSNPKARLVCLDLQPYSTVQAMDRDDILNIGGFSDQVFRVITEFAAGRLGADHWVAEIESIHL